MGVINQLYYENMVLSCWASIGCLHNCFKYHFLAICFDFKVMAISESTRLLASLKKEHVPVQRLVVNQVLPPSASECKFCEMKRKVLSQTSLFFNCNGSKSSQEHELEHMFLFCTWLLESGLPESHDLYHA